MTDDQSETRVFTPAPAPKVKTVGRYQIIEELGRGAMAVVYKGKDPVIGRTVALKTLLFREDNKEAKDLRQALYRDACAAGTLAHPNIVTIYDVIEEEGMTAVAMEFIEGRTLDSIIKEKAPLAIDMALGLFDQIVAGLDYAHTKGIIHRDVKPANIMLTTDGRVKVTDFGVARVTSAGATMTATVVGSPSYMSPEQIRGGKLDGRSDMFSAATVLYEMLTKERPFPGDDIATTLYRIVHELPTPPAEFNPAIGPELTAVFERAMAKDPNERYATGADLSKAARQAAEAKGRSTGRVTAAEIAATVKVTAASASAAAKPAARPAAAPAARAERAAAAAPIEEPKRGAPIGLIAGAVAAVLVLGAGGYFYLNQQGNQAGPAPTGGGAGTGTLVAQNSPPPPQAPPAASAGPTTGNEAPAGQQAQTPTVETPPPAVEPPAPTPPRPTNTAARRGGAANTTTTGAGRAARGTQATAATGAAAGGTAAQPAETPRQAAPPPVETPPPAPASTVTVQLRVGANAWSGLQITFDSRVVRGEDLPVVLNGVATGPHQVAYRWTTGPNDGKSVSGTVTLREAAGRAGGQDAVYRLSPSPNDTSITAVLVQ